MKIGEPIGEGTGPVGWDGWLAALAVGEQLSKRRTIDATHSSPSSCQCSTAQPHNARHPTRAGPALSFLCLLLPSRPLLPRPSVYPSSLHLRASIHLFFNFIRCLLLLIHSFLQPIGLFPPSFATPSRPFTPCYTFATKRSIHTYHF